MYGHNILITLALLGHRIFRVSSFDALAGFELGKGTSPWQIRSFRRAAPGSLNSIGGPGRITFLEDPYSQEPSKYPRSRALNQSYPVSDAGTSIQNVSHFPSDSRLSPGSTHSQSIGVKFFL